jgi:ligand-binding sensor domain-containing protein/two-component sensor histidine kinase
MTFKILTKHIIKTRSAICRLFCVVLLTLLCHLISQAQKYTFSHYDIEDGLIESQVNNLALDQEHRLWMATFGGACRFDGKDFTSYTRQNGMPTNFINNVFVDKDNVVWFGTQSGLMKLLKKKLVNYPVPVKLKNNRVRSIVQDGAGTVWFIMSNRLFKVSGNSGKEEIIQDTIKEPLLCLAVDPAGRLYASVHQNGIYCLDKGKWIKLVSYPKNNRDFFVTKILFDRTDKSRLLLLSFNGVYSVKNGMLQPYQDKLMKGVKGSFLSMEQDSAANLWVGTNNGAYYIDLKKQKGTHFVAVNGLSDNAITDIYNDADNNLWLASQGNGLYKYEGDRYVIFDRTQGLPNNEVIWGIAKERNNHILLGVNGAGLFQYDGKKLTSVKLPKDHQDLNNVQCLYTDRNGVIWIGTDHAGLWTYDNNRYQMIKGSDYYAINGITQDSNGLIWIVTQSGCFYQENNTLKRLEDFSGFCSSIVNAGKDSILAGTQDGVILAVNKKMVKGFRLDAVRTSTVFSMLNYKGMLIIGTDDRGIFVWNKSTGDVKNYSTKDGLNSNTIYSLVTDDHGVIWAGTGRGANRLLFDEKSKTFTVRGNGSSKNPILESNQNAVLYNDGKVWIGTTKGVVVYNTNIVPASKVPPHIVIQSVKLVSQGGEKQGSVTVANGTKLSFSNRHLSIAFLGINLTDPANVSYRYKLLGLDTAYSLPVKNNVVDYPSLPAGNYTFEVKAIGMGGTSSANTARFSFSITPPFYQTGTFRFLAITFFVLIGVTIQSYRHQVKINRLKIIEATKREESLRIRQQTAEDFHDELGNKLTRITVLSEILGTKMDNTQCDQKKLLEQIKQNAASLYNGTKDILWALDPQSDSLYEVLNHIRDFGKELFLDTPVGFEFKGIDESLNDIKLPMEYSRNIPMIFKELLNNILKHSHATKVNISLDETTKNGIHLTLTDNGCGFDENEIRKGQGINNIITRTKRINGSININSEKGKGTVVYLKIRMKPMVKH